MLKDYFSLALKNLKKRGLRSYLTLLGIFIGIVAVVALIGLGNGLKLAITSQFGVSSTEVISVQAGGLSGYGPPGTGVVNPLTRDDVEAIKNLNTVETALSRNIESLRVEYNNKLMIGYATNILSGSDRKLIYEILDLETEQGRLLEDGDSNKVVIGHAYSLENNVFNKVITVGQKIDIEGRSFEVKGILKKEGSFIFDNIFLLNDDELNSINDHGDAVDIIAVKVKSKDLMGKAKEEIEDLLRKRRDVKEGEEDFEVSTPQASLATVNQILTGVQIFIVMIALISIIVGAIGIVNTMTTSVLERRKEIGTMKAIGAKNSDIFYLFFIEAGLLGLIGGLLGVIVGELISYLGTSAINSFLGSEMKPEINFILIAAALLGSFILGSLSGIVPALKAAKENPVEALRS